MCLFFLACDVGLIEGRQFDAIMPRPHYGQRQHWRAFMADARRPPALVRAHRHVLASITAGAGFGFLGIGSHAVNCQEADWWGPLRRRVRAVDCQGSQSVARGGWRCPFDRFFLLFLYINRESTIHIIIFFLVVGSSNDGPRNLSTSLCRESGLFEELRRPPTSPFVPSVKLEPHRPPTNPPAWA
jgi:hypothetical protein